MNDYDLLGLMDTWNAMKASGIKGLPSSFLEALTGIKPVGNEPITIPQITQGSGGYDEGIKDVDQSATNARAALEHGHGKDRVNKFPIFGREATGEHKVNLEQEKRLNTRREIGYDK